MQSNLMQILFTSPLPTSSLKRKGKNSNLKELQAYKTIKLTMPVNIWLPLQGIWWKMNKKTLKQCSIRIRGLDNLGLESRVLIMRKEREV